MTFQPEADVWCVAAGFSSTPKPGAGTERLAILCVDLVVSLAILSKTCHSAIRGLGWVGA